MSRIKTGTKPVWLAIDACGGMTKLAEALGKYPQFIYNWTKLKNIPDNWIIRVEKVSGVDREKLRPDLFS
jgi:hypothetical protein